MPVYPVLKNCAERVHDLHCLLMNAYTVDLVTSKASGLAVLFLIIIISDYWKIDDKKNV